MATIRRANRQQKILYVEDGWHLYPLYGFAKIGEHDCYIEDLRDNRERDEPRYEVLAPEGHIFVSDGLHSMLCLDLKDLRDRVAYNTLEQCDCSSGGCDKYWERKEAEENG